MSKIGFVGLGNMGTGMCINLAKNKQKLFGFDISDTNFHQVQKYGVTITNSLKELTEESDIVITMLPNGKIVKEVWRNLIKFSKSSKILIDCSTIDLETSLEIQKQGQKNNLQTIDAPVSGGVVGANNATLTFMIGGKNKTVQKVKHLFDIMGQKAIICGNEGAGQSAKVCNNLLLASTMIAVGESFQLGKALNLDLDKLFEVISTSSGSCWAVNNYCPIKGVGPETPADNSYEGGFSADLMLKDLSLAIKAAKDTGIKVEHGQKTLENFKKLVQKKQGHLDFSNIVNFN